MLGAAMSNTSKITALPVATPEGEGLIAHYQPPLITIRAGSLHQVATEAEAALVESGQPLYVRGGEIVKPVTDFVDGAKGRRTSVARLKQVSVPLMVDHLSRSSRFEKYDARPKKYVLCDPPKALAETILARDGEWQLPVLAGLITCPTLRPDGSLLAAEGYDAATRLLLLKPPAMPEIKEYPTKDDAVLALALLDALLADFPFVDHPSRSVALSALMTPILRGAVPVAPMHGFKAPTAGSGKSYAVDLASAIATGQTAPVISVAKDAAETEKRLGAAILSGQPIVSLDNVNGDLGGDALCQIIERPTVQVRVLGLSKLVRIESRATIFCTGNNVTLVGDMTRRVMLCSLDPNMERPELRQFKADPLAAIMADRGQYIAAVLTIARAYSAAGFPEPRPALASFEDWSLRVRSALVWLGRRDPCDTMEAARGDDPQLRALRETVAAWHKAIGTDWPLSAGELCKHSSPELQQALLAVAADKGAVSATRLGKWLGRQRNKVIDGLKIVGAEDSHAKQTKWRLSKVVTFGDV
jgi:putative DNA primase/helicase